MKIKKIILGYLEENAYILTNREKAIIIDPGLKEGIEEYIEKNNLEVEAILVTHYHFDHTGGLEYLLEKYNTKLFDFKTLGKKNTDSFCFEIIETNGHTDDSVSFYFKEENVIFTGDFLFKNSIGRYDFENSDIISMQKSIEKIKKIPEATLIFPGHGESTVLKEELKYNYYLK